MITRIYRGVVVTLFAAGILVPASGPAAADEPANIRPAAVAGSFYPADPEKLARLVDKLLNAAPVHDVKGDLVALVSPHAGYVYSGHVAAHGYRLLRGRDIKRVVVISPSHIGAFPGAAVFDGDGYETPLGVVPVDREFAGRLLSSCADLGFDRFAA